MSTAQPSTREKVILGYECFQGYVNLYDRINTEDGQRVLKFRSQSSIGGKCLADAVKDAVDGFLKSEGKSSEISIHLIELEPTGWNTTYIWKPEK